MIWVRRYSSMKRDVFPSSTVKVYRKANANRQATRNAPAIETEKAGPEPKDCGDYVENEVKIQMISRNLHEQIFGKGRRKSHLSAATANKYTSELKRHGITVESTERMDDVHIKLPPLRGGNIAEHFYAIAKEQVAPYEQLLQPLVECQALPERPVTWEYKAGWTVYDPGTGKATSIEYPTEKSLIFDVEVCVSEGAAPILATAVGTQHWYSWVSPRLINHAATATTRQPNGTHKYSLTDLIPLGKVGPKVIVGHNVSYDRARVAEQYLVDDTGTRFVDTMSLHVCVSGVTSYQRSLLKSKKEPAPEDTEWIEQSALNSLVEVHRLYCGGEPLAKDLRNVFVEGSLSDVREDFQALVSYCAGDVEATHRVLRALYPMFKERFPHPATLAGMLEINSAYLPVNTNWLRYIDEANLAYEDLNIEAKYHLARRADEACALMRNEQFREHLWLWDEDWSVQKLKMKQAKISKKLIASAAESAKAIISEGSAEERRLREKFNYLYEMKARLPARRPLLPGYPAWYRKLCKKPPKSVAEDGESWAPGPTEISTGMQIAPKLLSLNWEGYPLHYLREEGWGFLVPFRKDRSSSPTMADQKTIPLEKLIECCPIPEFARNATESESEYAFGRLQGELDAKLAKRQFYSKAKKDHTEGQYNGSGVWCNRILDDCCYFIKLPHKNGKSYRVGNPLSRDFLNKFSENVLSSGDEERGSAARVIEIARMMSYWRNNRDRIMGQMVVWLPSDELPKELREQLDTNALREFGAICPQVVACGTLTRRAMEPTWLTASNSQRERIGSELRAMVQAPPSYKIVGADVDSQELWIASVLGDAYASGIHGVTPLGWMTLSGSKSNGTDMHSITAKAVGISRDHAKVINYARIYGAGQNFAEGLLKQFNPTFSDTEAKSKAMKMFAITKGKRTFRMREEFQEEYESQSFSAYEARKIALAHNRTMDEMFYKPHWEGGTESAMFNRLEEIAMKDKPVTPFLGCRLSRALESHSGNESRFLPTRVNWVVQSGAVDFLHLMLVAMRWLMGPHIRFCLSFHDELRYLVKDEMAYKTALAMHVTNLLTRSFCSAKIGLDDLPMSIAFFSSVEVDTVLRKESTMDCKTPSNPHGLQIGYGIPPGENLNIYKTIEKAGGGDLSKWEWVK